jgi:hypothetical protein
MSELTLPTEQVELPSKGLLYPETNPLASGTVEIKYMTAKEEDILTNTNYIQKGIVLDKLLESLIVSKINYNDLVTGDKNALLVGARVLGYGKDYNFNAFNPTSNKVENFTIDLTTLNDKNLDPKDLKEEGVNEFEFTLPYSKTSLTFKLLTHGDDKSIDRELQGFKKINAKGNFSSTTNLKHLILSINGDYENKTVREFVDTQLLARDARELRKHIEKIQPNVDLYHEYEDNRGNIIKKDIPVGISFFWPDASV